MVKKLIFAWIGLYFAFAGQSCLAKERFIVGSKAFVESYVLGEIAKDKLQKSGINAKHKKGMGGTLILWQALTNGSIDAYPEYTGTLQKVIFKNQDLNREEMKSKLKELGIGMTEELGFNNTYALSMREEHARSLGISRISDLKWHQYLRATFSHEFLNRKDGWEPLQERYDFKLQTVNGIETSLAFRAIQTQTTDLIDAYSTSPKVKSLNLRVLEDDLSFFPEYKAVYLYRLDANKKEINSLKQLENTIDNNRMISLNSIAEDTKSYKQASAKYFGEIRSTEIEFFSNQLKWISGHLWMVLISMLIAIVVGIPLGVFCSKGGWVSELVMGLVGVIQTVPSLALLALLVPLMDISFKTAIAALFLYSLLPIVRNTSSGLKGISQRVRDSAEVLGLSKFSQLTKVFLPLSSRTILAGIKTSTIINIGTATLASLIGAGGLGEPIVSGLYLNDNNLILQGAIPAALLAIAAQGLFNLMELVFIPRGLRLQK